MNKVRNFVQIGGAAVIDSIVGDMVHISAMNEEYKYAFAVDGVLYAAKAIEGNYTHGEIAMVICDEDGNECPAPRLVKLLEKIEKDDGTVFMKEGGVALEYAGHVRRKGAEKG